MLYPDLVSSHRKSFMFANLLLSFFLCWFSNVIVLIWNIFSFSFVSGVSGSSLFNSVSLMAYNVFYTSIPVLVSVLDKDLSERTVMQHPQILFYCQAGRFVFLTSLPMLSVTNFSFLRYVYNVNKGMEHSLLQPIFPADCLIKLKFMWIRLLNPSTFAGWFGRSLFHVSTALLKPHRYFCCLVWANNTISPTIKRL